jgi:hypothetical protein
MSSLDACLGVVFALGFWFFVAKIQSKSVNIVEILIYLATHRETINCLRGQVNFSRRHARQLFGPAFGVG